MALNLKSQEAERLAARVAHLTGESKTEAVRRSLAERLERLEAATGEADRERRMREFLTREVWAKLAPDQRGRAITEAEEDEILGYGASGV
jgi:antitoxin VapB